VGERLKGGYLKTSGLAKETTRGTRCTIKGLRKKRTTQGNKWQVRKGGRGVGGGALKG